MAVLDDFSGGSRENLSSRLGEPNFCLVKGGVRSKADVKRALEGVDFVFLEMLLMLVCVGCVAKIVLARLLTWAQA